LEELYMMRNRKKIRFFRSHIPEFSCVPGCHDCCGPIMASTEEMSRLPLVEDAKRETALAKWDCPHLGVSGCQVYEERPLICRLFGTTPRLKCPHGKQPETMIDAAIEMKIEIYFRKVRHVMV
jgi:Fe-S-cluster containining protein